MGTSTITRTLSEDLRQIIARLNDIGISLSSKDDPVVLQTAVLRTAKDIIGCDGGTMYAIRHLHQAHRELSFEVVLNDSLAVDWPAHDKDTEYFPPVTLYHADGSPNTGSVVAHAVISGCTINIPDAYDAEGFDFSGTRLFDERTGYHSESFLTVPMRNHDDEIIGVMQLINCLDENNRVIPFTTRHQRLAESLASQAAIALTRQQLVSGMRELFQSLIRMIADAIDAKSPFTGEHCRRVPELAMLLAEAAHDCTHGSLADFYMSEDDREQLSVAAWLHDCGKLTTPDWILDKATKLQGLYDRLQLIELRYEILRRDVIIAAYENTANMETKQQVAEAITRFDDSIDVDMDFLHRINRGVEYMDHQQQQRVRELADQTWIDRHGCECGVISPDEVEALCIAKGTLNERERHQINDHIRVTIDMLEALPFPKHLQRVPEIAGAHHEKLDGTGYPRGLTAADMSVEARLMCIADIFEALTASDRPYKQPMPLSQSLNILAGMVKTGSLDKELFSVFLRSGACFEYAEKFLVETQRDVVDVEAVLATL